MTSQVKSHKPITNPDQMAQVDFTLNSMQELADARREQLRVNRA